jgi:hypothetical protein
MNQLAEVIAKNQNRKDESPIEEARFFSRLKTEFGLSAKEIAKMVFGEEAERKHKDFLVLLRLELLKLTPEEQDRVHKGKMGVIVAIALLRMREQIPNEEKTVDRPRKTKRAKTWEG